MIAAKMNTTPTFVVFDYQIQNRMKVKIMQNNLEIKKVFDSISGARLAEMELPSTKFVIKDLLPQGLAIIGGSPKVGKSWLVLDWCVWIAKGEKIWNFPTTKGTTLYLSLEDNNTRLQERLLAVTEDAPENVHFVTSCCTLDNGLEEQMRNFVAEHPDTVLVVIDTFQMIRLSGNEVSYASDYNEIEVIKKLAEELKITILLVHHLRKQGDSDPFNMLSGTNGLAGGVDTMFVLDKSKRNSSNATLHCSGRDIEDREIELSFDKENCVWNFIADSSDNPEMLLPVELQQLIDFMKSIYSFSGSNSDFIERYNQFTGREIKANSLKRMMNHWKTELNESGVIFRSRQSNGKKYLDIRYQPQGVDGVDSVDINEGDENIVSIVPIDPVSD